MGKGEKPNNGSGKPTTGQPLPSQQLDPASQLRPRVVIRGGFNGRNMRKGDKQSKTET